MLRFFTFFVVFIFYQTGLQAQCSINAKREVCVNDLVNFSITVSSGSPASYDWDFGTFGSSTNTTPLMKFTSAGKLLVKCTVTLAGGQKCSDTHSMEILPLPYAKAALASESLLCLNESNVCFNDSSKKATHGISSVSVLWGDGNLDKYNTPIPKKWCHKYTDTGWFTFNMEIEDSTGCKAKFSVDIHSHRSVEAALSYTETILCDSIKVCLSSKVTGGNTITNDWYYIPSYQKANITLPWCKVLQPKEKLHLSMVSTNEHGCKDSTAFQYVVPASNFFIKKLKKKVCVNELENGALTFLAGEEMQWYLNGALAGIDNKFILQDNAKIGMNYIRAQRIGGCTGNLFDSVEVVGVRAVGKLYNENRRKIIDTVFFLDLTKGSPGSSLQRIWDFGDKHALQCTTWTAKGINVGKNCNFSRDSIGRHFYPDTQCYVARLVINDLLSGCGDDSLVPIYRKDFCPRFIFPDKVCLGDEASFNLPINVRQKVQNKNFLIVDLGYKKDTIVLFGGSGKYVYKTIGFKSPILWRFYDQDTVWTEQGGKMVIKLIRPGDGWVADTFKNQLEVMYKANAGFKITKLSECNPFKVRLDFADSIWKYPSILEIQWGDTLIKFDQFTDSVYKLKSMEHVYATGGQYFIYVRLVNKTGCGDMIQRQVTFSHRASFGSLVKCPSDAICFKDSVLDFASNLQWTATNNMGQLYWDFGDGTKDSGFNKCHTFPGTGKYYIKMTAVSKQGCKVAYMDTLDLRGPVAAIKYQPTIYCSEIRQYFDSSFVMAPANGQVVNQWTWDFGDGTAPSFVKNPAHIFAGGGLYTVKLKIKTNRGCMDSTSRSFSVIGPDVKAAIISDSIGCAPMKITFDNLSKNTRSFIWEYGDPKNTMYSTDRDTNTTFTYTKGGVYYAYITGGDSFTNSITGRKYYCSVRYPQPGQNKLRITVYESGYSSFDAPPLACVNDSLLFVNTSAGDTNLYQWNFGDGHSEIHKKDTFKYKYKSTGKYKVSLFVVFPGGVTTPCTDTAVHDVQVVVLQPGFEADCQDTRGASLALKNTSGFDVPGYRWTLLNPLDSSETLLSEDIHFRYHFGKDTGEKIICLGINDGKSCGGKFCKSVIVQGDIFMANVFTPGKDGFNDTYKVPLYGYDDFDLRIFNRWGERVFHTTDPRVEWNGRVGNSGSELPEGTYFYRVEYRIQCGGDARTMNGSINLIR